MFLLEIETSKDQKLSENISLEDIRRSLPTPEFALNEIVLPDQWMNIPRPLIKAFESIIENDDLQEKNIKTLNDKVYSLASLMDKQSMEIKT